MDLQVDFKIFLDVEKGRAENTSRCYLSDLGQFERFIKKNLVQISPRDIRSWMGVMKSRGYRNETISRKLSSLRQFYRFLQKEKVIEKDPLLFIERPKREKRLPEFLTQEETGRLLDFLSSRAYDLKGKRDYVIASLLYYTGMRISELTNLRLSDIQSTEGGVTVRVKGKGNKERIIPLNRKVQDVLMIWQMTRPNTMHDYIFVTKGGEKLYSRYPQRLFRRIGNELGINKRLTPHKLRHTFATHLLHKGEDLINIQNLLGHATLATTQIYAHTTMDRLNKAVEKL